MVVGSGVVLGSNVTLMQGCTLGGNFDRSRAGVVVPVLGDDVFVGPGAGIFGPVHISAAAIVGANVVVTRDL
ncbi:hypothetical protein JYP47_06645 [Microbacterium esteraromaticum]|nr:hypothetical protein [Microbacterium esteraromaticum]